MFVPLWLLVVAVAVMGLVLVWAAMVAAGRNPLPFPDRGSRIFAASSPEAKEMLVALLRQYGLKERFRMDSSGIARSILWDGTIINANPPALVERLGGAGACIGLVADDPRASAHAAAAFLRAGGYSAEVVEDAEPALPICFVLTDAFVGAALNFRPHVVRMPRPVSP